MAWGLLHLGLLTCPLLALAAPAPAFDLSSLLSSCEPCGKTKCSFAGDANAGSTTFRLMIGSPVTNCDDGSTEPVISTVGGSITMDDSWSADVSVGLYSGPLRIQAGGNWSQSRSISMSQQVSIQVQPGQMGVLVAMVQYKQTSGSMKIAGQFVDSPLEFPLTSNQPITVLSVGPEVVPCASQFNVNDLNSLPCASGARTQLQGKSLSLKIFALVLLLWLFLL